MAKRAKPVKADEDIPTFLRIPAERRRASWDNLPPAAGAGVRVEKMANPKRGEYPSHWYDDPGFVRMLREREAEVVAKKESRIEKQRELREARPTKKSVTEGMTSLATLLEEMGEAAPSRAVARRALDTAKVIHRRYHFDEMDVVGVRALLAKLPAASAPRPVGSADDAALFDHAHYLRALVAANPRRPGSAAAARMGTLLAACGGTVGAYLAAGGNATTLKNGVAKEWVAVEEAAAVPTKKRKR